MTPTSNTRRLAAAVALLLAAASPTRADDIVLKDAASMSGGVMWLSSGAPGLVLAAVRRDDSIVLGFGETRPGSKVEPTGRSILRMGSIAKVMAGQTLASMVADGTVKLTEPLAPGVGVRGSVKLLSPLQVADPDGAGNVPGPVLGSGPCVDDAEFLGRCLEFGRLDQQVGARIRLDRVGIEKPEQIQACQVHGVASPERLTTEAQRTQRFTKSLPLCASVSFVPLW